MGQKIAKSYFDYFRRPGGNGRMVAMIMVVGVISWLASVPFHHWNSGAQAAGCMAGVGVMAWQAMRCVRSPAAGAYETVYVSWFALFGVAFFFDTYFSPPDLVSISIFSLLIVMLVWFRIKYRS